MSAPTPAPGDDRPREGYYPDPSIPGYVRYWNGAAWVPGTSRPAPSEGETLPTPAGAAPPPASVEETGPVFLDEEPSIRTETGPEDGSAPEPASAWAADTTHQSGFGGDQDRRVSWGSEPSPLPGSGTPGAESAPSGRGDAGSAAPAGFGAAPGPFEAGAQQVAGGSGAPGGSAGHSGSGVPVGSGVLGGSGVPVGSGGLGGSGVPAGSGGPGGSGVPVGSGGLGGSGAPVGSGGPGGSGSPGASAGPGGSGAPGGSPGPSASPDSGASADSAASGTPAGPGAPGGPDTPAAPNSSPADRAAASNAPARSEGTVTIRAVRPGAASASAPRTDGTMTIRPVPQQSSPQQQSSPPPQQGPVQAPAAKNRTARPAGTTPADPRAATPGQAQAPAATPNNPGYGYPRQAQSAPAPNPPGYGYPQQAQPAPAQARPGYGYPQPDSPVTQGPGGGSASWAQQVHQLAEPDGPVTPFKPVASDPFLAAAQAQASARPAGLGKRFVARLIDTLVLCAITAAAAVPLGIRAADHINGKIDAAKASGRQVTVWLLDGTTATYLGIVLAVLLVVGVLYEALPTAKWGRTLGKKLMGLNVREIEGADSPPFGRALLRWFVYVVPCLLGIGLLGVLWGLIDRPWRQCLHDKAARTFVAR
ncbi:RDD family protein [Streptomyces sp. NPDC016845]|uniref:RDD family protein n=1 Tax=Streptomyces sp. NPDC016845 TaxID=3364972 RepID=UPI0037B62F0B